MEKNKFNRFIDAFQELIEKKVLIACSTGLDSMVLLNLAIKTLTKDNIGIAHVNQKKRLQSEEEQKFIEKFAAEQNIKLFVKELDIYNKDNFQAWARTMRYDFFNEIVEKEAYDYVLLAHHADDNLETILMRLLKSSSLKGYSGIDKECTYKNTKIYRPLLEFSKDELMEYAKIENITYFEDNSNTTDDYTRNRIRKHIVPLLKQENPNIYEAVNNYANTLKQADAILEKNMNLFIKNHVFINTNIKYIVKNINYLEYINLTDFLKEQILFRLTKEIGLSKRTINELIKQIKNKDKLVNKLTDELLIVKENNYIRIIIGDIENDTCLNIQNDDQYYLNDDIKINVERNVSLYQEKKQKICYNIKDLKVPGYPIVIRNKQPGDKIKLQSGTVSVSDYLTNYKLNYLSRNNTYVVLYDNKIINVLIYTQCEEDKNE